MACDSAGGADGRLTLAGGFVRIGSRRSCRPAIALTGGIVVAVALFLCEGGGVPLALEIAGANVNDFKLLRATLEQQVLWMSSSCPLGRKP